MENAKLVSLPKILDKRGNLSFFENENQIPFVIKRTYWIYDVPGGQTRGGHAFKESDEFVIALSGSFDVVLNNGFKETKYSLNRSYNGLFVPKLKWRRLENFSTNSLALIVSSIGYKESDYLRDFKEFKKILNETI
jgi:hypothetical protein